MAVPLQTLPASPDTEAMEGRHKTAKIDPREAPRDLMVASLDRLVSSSTIRTVAWIAVAALTAVVLEPSVMRVTAPPFLALLGFVAERKRRHQYRRLGRFVETTEDWYQGQFAWYGSIGQLSILGVPVGGRRVSPIFLAYMGKWGSPAVGTIDLSEELLLVWVPEMARLFIVDFGVRGRQAQLEMVDRWNRQRQRLQEFVGGQRPWTDLQRLGCDITFDDGVLQLEDKSTIVITPTIRDVASGFTRTLNSGSRAVQEWSAVVLGLNGLDFTSWEGDADADVLMDILWRASSGETIPDGLMAVVTRLVASP